jgi:hypothetical protein
MLGMDYKTDSGSIEAKERRSLQSGNYRCEEEADTDNLLRSSNPTASVHL